MEAQIYGDIIQVKTSITKFFKSFFLGDQGSQAVKDINIHHPKWTRADSNLGRPKKPPVSFKSPKPKIQSGFL